MPLVTLTTDWDLKDYYVSAIKGMLYSRLADVLIVDISHKVKLFDQIEASFIVRQSYPHFPAGSIHLIGVNSMLSRQTQLLAARYNGHYFICADNGILPMIIPFHDAEVVSVIMPARVEHSPFPVREIFVDVVVKIASGTSLGQLGEPIRDFTDRKMMTPIEDGNSLRGAVVYIDTYGNLITNIDYDLFNRVRAGRPYTIFMKSTGNIINRISLTYGEVGPGDPLALFNSSGFLEIALAGTNASKLLGAQINELIKIDFHDSPNS